MIRLPEEIIPYFEEAGWKEGRKIDLSNLLKNEFGEYPENYLLFMSEFLGLEIHNKGEIEYISDGQVDKIEYDNYIHFDLMYGEELVIDAEGEEGGIKYYSDLIGKKLYPIGMVRDDFTAAVDENLAVYIFNTGILGCVKVHDDPYQGLKCILKNDLYTHAYILEEEGEHKGKWFKRKVPKG
ncbi:SUKH-3 domain-containing protein [Limibacter armeniacum]|uniref:SUKH-3 domain-containing protein n=1 Tax=Limibacter armeniacum TaxID=466084 RepID=UPI002FE589AE